MSEAKGKGRQRGLLYLALVLAVVLVCVLCFYELAHSSSRLALDSSTELNRRYLREMTEQLVGHFNTSLNGRFSMLRTVAASTMPEDLESTEALTSFLAEVEQINSFGFVAFVDEQGFYYSTRGVRPAASRLSFLAELLEGETNLISYNEVIGNENMIVLGARIEPIRFGDKTFIGILAGFDSDDFSAQLALQNDSAQTYASIVTSEGSFIVYNTFNSELPRGSNIFSKMAAYAEFADEYTLERMRQDFAAGRSDMTVFNASGRLQCMYYSPLADTDWYVLLEMPYDVIDAMISGLTGKLYRNSLLAMIAIMLVIFALFALYMLDSRRNARELLAANAAARIERDRAERASKAKSVFLGRMSHELRTPMNGIIGMTAIARNNLHDPNKVGDCLRKVELSSQHMLALVSDMLDMAKVESGTVELKYEPFDLGELLDHLDSLYREQAKERKLSFEIIVEGELDAQVVGDAPRLTQILANLLSNAIKFTNEGSVRLCVRCLKRDNLDIWLRFEVTDTGVGIRQEHLSKIFIPFEQANAGIAQRYGGTGLGLSIVKRFVVLMGGTVEAESKLGEGSAFAVNVPFRRVPGAQPLRWGEAPQDAETGEVEEYDFTGKCILLAEDNELNREIAIELLGEETGAEMVAAEDGAEAVKLFAESEVGGFDMILMDLQMPNMDGYEATRAIRAMDRPDAKTIPILAVTANAFAEDVEKCFAAGMNAHLSKPLEIEAVYAAMHDILKRGDSAPQRNQ